jgi:hypothetical protein
MDTTLKIGSLVAGAFVTLLAAGLTHDGLFRAHMAIACLVLLIGAFLMMRQIDFSHAAPARKVDKSGYFDEVIRYGVIATIFWGVVGFLVGVVVALQLAFPDLDIEPYLNFGRLAAAAHIGGHIRLRRQCADRDVLLRRPAHLPRPPVRWRSRLVRVLGLPVLHYHGRDRLSAGHHPGPRICRARMVRGHLADCRLGRISCGLPGHAGEAQGAAYLCRELVLPRPSS